MYREFRLLDSILAGDERGVLLTEHDDPSTVFGFCCGDDLLGELPINSMEAENVRIEEAGVGRAHYTACPIWQREKTRIAVGAEAIFPKPTSRPNAAGSLGLDEAVGELDGRGQRVLKQVRAARDDFDALDWLVDE
jgi:hypothetical protein